MVNKFPETQTQRKAGDAQSPALRLATSTYSYRSYSAVSLMFLSCPLDVLDHRAQLFPERLIAVIDTVQVRACTSHALNNPTRLFNVLIRHLVQRKLR